MVCGRINLGDVMVEGSGDLTGRRFRKHLQSLAGESLGARRECIRVAASSMLMQGAAFILFIGSADS